MKKRLIISNYDDIHNPYYAGGGARAVHETARRLSRTFTVTVLTGSYAGARNGRIDGVTYLRTGIRFGGPKLGQLVYQLVLPYRVMTMQYDLWLESFTPPFSTGLLQLFTRKPVVGLVHMLSGEDMKRKYHLPFDLVEKVGLMTYRTFIATSEYSKQKISRVNPGATVMVIPNGVTVSRRRAEARKNHILFLGRIEVDQKGLDLLLTAYKKLGPDRAYPLVIAGGGEPKQIRILNDLITSSGLSDNVRYVGKVEGATKAQLLREAVCLAVPSRFETFSLVALEGIAAGIPIVSFRIPGLSWVPAEAGIQVPAFNTTAYAAALRNLVTTKPARSVRLTRFLKQYSWETVGEQYERFVTSMIAR